MEDEQKLVDPLEKFSPLHKEAVEGLIYLGHLSKEVKFCGHRFVLRTLKPAERAAIGIAIQPWANTLMAAEVFNNAHIGMALVSIDGDAAFCPQAGPNIDDFALRRLQYLTEPETGWHQPTLDFLYATYLSLEVEAAQAIEALRDFYERGRTPSSSSVENLTDKDFSNEPISGDTPIST